MRVVYRLLGDGRLEAIRGGRMRHLRVDRRDLVLGLSEGCCGMRYGECCGRERGIGDGVGGL